jgi:hypothetical protein
MRKMILLGSMMFFGLHSFSQEVETLGLDVLIERYDNIPSNGGALSHYFTSNEMTILRNHFNDQTRDASENQIMGEAIFYGPNTTQDIFISFGVDAAESFNDLGPGLDISDFEAAGAIDPQDPDTAYVLTYQSGEFYKVDIPTVTYTYLGTIPTPTMYDRWNGLEFDPQTNVLYAPFAEFGFFSGISTIDIENMIATPILFIPTPGLIAIAIDNNSNLWGYDVGTDHFYYISLNTGQITDIGPIGFDANFGQDLTWDPEGEIMYMTAYNRGNSKAELRTVNLETGLSTFVSNIGLGWDSAMPWSLIKNGVLSVDENKLSKTVEVFPNPSSTMVTLIGSEPMSNIEIINTLGQIVFEKSIGNVAEDTFDISELSSGVYYIRVYGDSKQPSFVRFLKE